MNKVLNILFFNILKQCHYFRILNIRQVLQRHYIDSWYIMKNMD